MKEKLEAIQREVTMSQKYGYSVEDWDAAKAGAKSILSERAKRRDIIAYSELVMKIQAIPLEPNSPALANLLREISEEEDAQGRGLLTVIVVQKEGDKQPGQGFFDLAKLRGRDTGDTLKCWIAELNKVYAAWATKHQ